MFRKHSDDIPELTLPKWPFILGDLLLVATALAIAILGNWQLTDWQVVACVLAVALGAALFVLPFIVEYHAREQENSSASASQSALLARHVQDLESRTAVMADQITRLGMTQAEAAKAQPPAAFDAAALRVIEDRLDRQAKQLEAAEQNLEKIRAAQTTPSPATAKSEPAPEKQPAPAPAATPKVKPAPKPTNEARPRKPAESQLLKRAIHEKQDRAAQAVDRIIESKPSQDKKETPQVEPEKKDADAAPKPEASETPKSTAETPKPAPTPTPKPEPEAAPEAKPAPEAEAIKPAPAAPKPKAVETPKPEPEPKVEAKPEPEAKPAAPEAKETAPLKTPESTPKSAPEAKPEAKTEDKSDPETKPEPAPEPKPEAAPSLFEADEASTNPVSAKKGRKKNETACTVNSLIGIGNKPYLRGSGGGLNWDSGVVMEFEAIGKWRWAVPADLDSPIEVQVYRNDEDPDTSGKHTLKPGKALEINAKF